MCGRAVEGQRKAVEGQWKSSGRAAEGSETAVGRAVKRQWEGQGRAVGRPRKGSVEWGRCAPAEGDPSRRLAPASPELQINIPAHTKHPGWYVDFEFRGRTFSQASRTSKPWITRANTAYLEESEGQQKAVKVNKRQ